MLVEHIVISGKDSNADKESHHIKKYLILNHVGVEVFTLAGQNVPVVESSRSASKMPLANHRRLIACRLKKFWEGLLGAVEGFVGVIDFSIDVAVFACKYYRPAWCADAVCAEAIFKEHSFFGNAINIWCFVDPAAVTAHGM